MTPSVAALVECADDAVERMREMISSLERNGWQLYAHTLYMPMVKLEQAADVVKKEGPQQ